MIRFNHIDSIFLELITTTDYMDFFYHNKFFVVLAHEI